MTITKTTEIETSLQMSENLEWTRVAIYECLSDTPKEDPFKAYQAVKAFSKYELFGPWAWGKENAADPPDHTDSGLFHIGTDVRLRNWQEDRKIWRVTLQFRDFNMIRRARAAQPNAMKGTSTPFYDKAARPQDEGSKWRGHTRQIEEEAVTDAKGAAIVNKADQPYKPLKIFTTEESIEIEFVSSTLDLGLRSRFLSGLAMNSEPFWGYPKHCLRLFGWEQESGPYGWVEPADPDAPTAGEGVQQAVWQRITIGIKLGELLGQGPPPDYVGWKKRLPNYGTIEKDAQGTNFEDKYRAIEVGTTISGGLIPGPNFMLDDDGKVKADQTALQYNTFEPYNEQPFTDLPSEIHTLPAEYTNGLIPPP